MGWCQTPRAHLALSSDSSTGGGSYDNIDFNAGEDWDSAGQLRRTTPGGPEPALQATDNKDEGRRGDTDSDTSVGSDEESSDVERFSSRPRQGMRSGQYSVGMCSRRYLLLLPLTSSRNHSATASLHASQ